jgi:hypothetical protein
LRYLLQFGQANAGGAPTFVYFRNADTDVAITPPAISEIGNGEYAFTWDWALTSVSSISYLATLNGVDLSAVIQSDQVVAGSVSAGAGAGVNPWLWTAGQILNMAATECGLAEVSDPYASTDPKFVQLRTLLKSAGDEIMKRRDWTDLVKECTIAGDGTTTSFALPADFLKMKDESGYDRSGDWPFRGPASSKEWQRLTADGVTPSLQPIYRLQQGRIVFYEAPATGTTLAFEYVSRYWIASEGSAVADSYFPAVSGDKVLLEPFMVMRLVKAKFRKAKGFPDADGDFADYEIAYEAAAGLEPARVLNLGGCPSGTRFIDTDNIPETVPGL